MRPLNNRKKRHHDSHCRQCGSKLIEHHKGKPVCDECLLHDEGELSASA